MFTSEHTTDVHDSGVLIAKHVVISMQNLQATLLNKKLITLFFIT